MKKIELNDGQDYLYYREGSGDTVEIFDIAVNSERGVGNGRKLVDTLRSQVETHLIFALTRVSNIGAQKFYLKVGFHNLGRLKKFYSDEDAVMFASYENNLRRPTQ